MADTAVMGVPAGAIVVTRLAQSSAILRGYAVKQGTLDNQVVLAGSAEEARGIAQEGAAENAVIPVVVFGPCIGIAGNAITPGAFLKVDTGGDLVVSAGEDTANIGWALSHADAAGDEVVMFVLPVKKRS